MGGDRRIGVAVDFSDCSRRVLKWALDNIARSGDHLILITVRPQVFYEGGEMQLYRFTFDSTGAVIESGDHEEV
ncbi:hypothetical protein QQ045_026015 [Rhodiola kirilowii]